MNYLGIDVSKAKLDCTLLVEAQKGKRKTKVVSNTAAGVEALVSWCAKHGAEVDQLHAIMEATGPYCEQSATALHDAGVLVSIVNPAQARDFARALAVHSKTDAIDSLVLARFGDAMHPVPWEPPALSIRQLRALLARRDALSQDLRREQNRREQAEFGQSPELIERSIADSIVFLKGELKRLEKAINDHIDRHPDLRDDHKLLQSIPGVGPQVGNMLLALMHGGRFKRAEQLAAYLGVIPVERQSGTSLHRRPRLSKAGNAQTRAKLYMAAIVAKQHNPQAAMLYERMVASGKAKMSALGAVMRKLVHLCFGVLKTRQPYRIDYFSPA